jgi:cobalamin biosynthesis protein CobT
MTDRGGRSSEVADRLGKRFDTDEPDDTEATDEQNEQPSERSDNDQHAQHSEQSDHEGNSDSSDNADRSERSDTEATSEQSDRSDNPVNEDRVQNVKQEWNGTYIYLPDELDSPFDAEFDRLVYECGRELNWKPKKNRHYYPVVIMYGIEAVEEMNAETFKEHVGALDLV